MSTQPINLTDRMRGLYPHRFYKLKSRLKQAYKRDDISLHEWSVLLELVRTNDEQRVQSYLDYLACKDVRTWWDKLLLRKPIYRDI